MSVSKLLICAVSLPAVQMITLLLPTFIIVPAEGLFGRAPFASKSFAELEEKIRSNQSIEVSSHQL